MSLSVYIKKHWRGELSLARSFWFNGFLLTILLCLALILPIGLAYLLAPLVLTFKVTFIAMSLFIAISYPLYIWQIVGIWRARKNHSGTTFGKLASIIAILLLAGSLAHTFITMPKTYETYSSMLKTFYQGGFNGGIENNFFLSGKKYKLELVNNGEALHVLGLIQFGMAKDIEAQLRKHPSIKTIIINSTGGSEPEAHLIVKLVQKYKLNTQSTYLCASACTNVFVAGLERQICPKSKIGFHNASILDTVADKSSDAFTKGLGDKINKRFIELCKKQNVAQSFLDAYDNHVINKPGNDLWIPSPQELIDMNYAHTITNNQCDIDATWLVKLYEEKEKTEKKG